MHEKQRVMQKRKRLRNVIIRCFFFGMIIAITELNFGTLSLNQGKISEPLVVCAKIAEEEKEEEPEQMIVILEEVPVWSDSSAKTYMDYRTITDETSEQWRLIYSDEIFISSAGFLQDNSGYIGAALGSYFGSIGSRYHFVLDTGTVLRIIKVEEKSDQHTVNGYWHQWGDNNVIEFVIDEQKMTKFVASNGLVHSGNFNNSEEFRGSIKEIWRVVE